MKNIQKKIAIFFFIFSILGFLDATYLTLKHYKGSIPPCTIEGCEVVLTSPQSVILGVPVALLGSLYYLFVLLMMVAYFDTKNTNFIKKTAYMSIFGFVGSLYFVYLQIFVINSICQYCMISALTSTLIFIAGMCSLFLLKKDEKSKKESVEI